MAHVDVDEKIPFVWTKDLLRDSRRLNLAVIAPNEVYWSKKNLTNCHTGSSG